MKKINLHQKITWFTGIVIAALTISIPLGYFVISYHYQKGSLETETEYTANIITQIISLNPEYWEFEQVRLKEYLSRRSRAGEKEIRRLINNKNKVVAESVDEVASPLMTQSSVVMDAGFVVGTIEISRPLTPLLKQSSLLLLLIAPIGCGLFLAFYRYPIREMWHEENLRKQAEETLRRSRKELHDITSHLGEGIYVVDTGGRITFMNPMAEKLLGWTAEELNEKGAHNTAHCQKPDGTPLPVEECRIHGVIRSAEPYSSADEVFVRKDGTVFPVSVISTPIFDNGKIIGAVSGFTDFTERKQAEAKLADALELNRKIVNESVAGIVAFRENSGQCILANNAAARIVGVTVEKMLAQNLHELRSWRVSGMYETALNVLAAAESARKEHRITTNFGRSIWLDCVFVKFMSSGDPHLLVIFEDITERKKAEEERLKNHTLESVGILAGGIAHDLNNLLNSIIGNIVLARTAAPTDVKVLKRLSDAEEICYAASELSDRLITFSPGGCPITRRMSMSSMLTDTVTALLKDSGISPVFHIPENLYAVNIDERQMEQVFKNLVVNAKEAMPKGGSFTIRGENLNVSEPDNVLMKEGRYVRISLSDTGAGIPAERLTKIFGAYYSTKDTYSQKGLGLGLAVCHSIVKKHDGLITVESEVGKGATFHIYLPAAS